MNFNKIPAGKKLPNDIYVIIEIKANDKPVKYEIDKETNNIFVDRFISTAMLYPCNYGYINNTLSLDGDPLDVIVQTMYSLQPGSVIRCRPVGLLNMIDESGPDKKIFAVPHTKISKEYDYIKDIEDIPQFLKSKIIYFFKNYKNFEKDKWVKINGWENLKSAQNEILSSFKRANK